MGVQSKVHAIDCKYESLDIPQGLLWLQKTLKIEKLKKTPTCL